MISIDYKGHPKKSLWELFKEYGQDKMLILDDVLATEDTFEYIYQDMLDFLKYGLEYKLIREYPIHFVFHRPSNGEAFDVHTLEVRHFLSNMCMWYACVELENTDMLDESYIIDWKGKNAEFVANFIDTKLIPFMDGDFHAMNAIVDEILYHIKAISDAFCLIFGYSASIYDLMQAEKQIPEIHDILYDPIDPTLQPREMEALLKEKNDRLMELYAEADSDLRPLLLSGKNISANQFKETFLRIGFKADLSNRTIPYFIDENLLITGICSPASYFIEIMSGRRAQMDAKLQMSKPGALSKKMNNNSTAVILRQDHEICDSCRPVYYTIEDDDFLRMLDKRNYYDERGEMHMLHYETDKHLIGKTLGFRSPTTCTSKDGICEACYGGLFGINKDLFSQGSLAATKDSEPVGQLVLSQKHSQFTTSDEIKFDDAFDQYFEIASTEINLSDTADIDSGMMIQLGPVTIEDTDEGDIYRIDYFDLVNFNGEVVNRIKEQNEFPLYLAPEMVSAWKQSSGHPIPFSRFDDVDGDVVLFNIEVKSKAVTQSLQLITAALDSKDHLGCSRDLDGLCQKFGRIMIDSNIKYNFVHHEMIIRSLLRKVEDENQYPDFGPNGDHSNYIVLRLTSSLTRNPSPIVRLSTGWLKKSLISTALYKSHQPSHLDALFVPRLTDVIEET